MSYRWMISLLTIISTCHSIYGTYHYVGCYTQVFYESFFTSSFMEPTLCFRLCDTPIIYLQKTVCRCSGGGVMHHNKQDDKYCTISCTKPADRLVQTDNTCGGSKTYSVYAEEQFYIRHGHLFNYQIQFLSCELWIKHDVYDTFSIKLDNIIIESSLNKMEKCAAACLDQNTTTKSIEKISGIQNSPSLFVAFNNVDDNKCLCIMPWKSNTAFQRLHYLQILPNNSCDRYCNNTSDDATVGHKFQCGSSKDPQIWAIYDLNGTCPSDFIYIKEIKKCMFAYKTFWSFCPIPSKLYIYDGNVTWKIFLKIIDKLKLNGSLVTIHIDENSIIDPSWKCASTTTTTTTISTIYYSYGSYGSRLNSNNYRWNSNTRYILENGCLRESSSSNQYSNRLCIIDPINKYSSSDNDGDASVDATNTDLQIKFCPTDWFDVNGRCYRMSRAPKTIQDARNSCINISKTESNKNDDDDNDDEQLNNSPNGDIVQYTSLWQARLGFFLLDTVPEIDVLNTKSTTQKPNDYYPDLEPLGSINYIYRPSINEFQMINPTEMNNSSMTDNSCVISTRTVIETDERPILQNTQMDNCSKARHVLCETKTLLVQNFQQGCFRKPLTLDLPSLISNRLTHELCVSVCRELQTKLSIIHINKCYCLNGITSKVLNLTEDLRNYQQNSCGNPCSGNRYEQCGNEDTIVVFHILDSRRPDTNGRTPAEVFPDFKYDGCIHVNVFNPLTTYQFKANNFHPRHCLELCTKYQQKYTLMNSNTCFCTNIPIKDEQYKNTILLNQYCSQQCAANYLYTCGNKDNSSVYSMYIMQPKCRHGFEVAENDQQCVYSHLSVKKKSFPIAQSYCNSIGGVIAKINDVLEIQDILPESMLKEHQLEIYGVIYLPRYFWIDRTLNIPNNNTISNRLLGKCLQTSKQIDRNCIVVYRELSSNTTNSSKRCITESDQCSSMSAVPICVDQHLEMNTTDIPLITNDISSNLSANVSIDYSCGDDTEYHFVDDYCYKISFHEVNWNDAKSECQRDNAMIFVPEKSITLQIIKSLFLHRSSYTASGYAHVGVIYDNQNRTVIQYNTTNNNSLRTVPDSNAVYDLCETTFDEYYRKLMSSKSLSSNQRNQIKNQQIGCAYVDLLSDIVPVIRCDEIPCNRIATVICQKSPILKTAVVIVNREYIQTSKINDQSTNESSGMNFPEYTKSVGRDFAPIFSIVVILFSLILLGFISTLYNHRLFQKNNNPGRHHMNSVYSQLTSANEFD